MATIDSSQLVFDAVNLNKQANIPTQLVWPDDFKTKVDDGLIEEQNAPVIDFHKLQSCINDPQASKEILEAVRRACETVGFFHLKNHNVDSEFIAKVYRITDQFFKMPLSEKNRAQRKSRESYGYSSSFTDRWSAKLPWKETLSIRHLSDPGASGSIHDYFVETMGQNFHDFGMVWEEYCNMMHKLSLEIVEMLGVSLGLERSTLVDYFKGSESIMRVNYYPPCQQPQLTLGTGPHCDGTSVTILSQDDIPGLQVFSGGKWQAVTPRPNEFIIMIGDTLMALTNKRYKSCLHRAVVNDKTERKSLAFFLNPNRSTIITPPETLVDSEHPRVYPDFKWGQLVDFTHTYMADMNTINAFVESIRSSNNN